MRIRRNSLYDKDWFTWDPKLSPIRVYHKRYSIWLRWMMEEEPAWMTRLLELYCGPENGDLALPTEVAPSCLQEVSRSIWGNDCLRRKIYKRETRK
jgi:hypothetical protein